MITHTTDAEAIARITGWIEFLETETAQTQPLSSIEFANGGALSDDLRAILTYLDSCRKAEPVAWRYRFAPDVRWHTVEFTNDIPKRYEFPKLEVQPLYTAPPSPVPAPVPIPVGEVERLVKSIIDRL